MTTHRHKCISTHEFVARTRKLYYSEYEVRITGYGHTTVRARSSKSRSLYFIFLSFSCLPHVHPILDLTFQLNLVLIPIELIVAIIRFIIVITHEQNMHGRDTRIFKYSKCTLETVSLLACYTKELTYIDKV
jgi:hypothetical protein